MPKQKTKKNVVKRFKVTSGGKILRRRNFTRHLSEKRSSKTKRRLKRSVRVGRTYEKKLRKILGVRK